MHDSCEFCRLRYHEAPAPSCSTPYLHFTLQYPIRETCRQIRNEAERIWLKMCTLTFSDPALCSLVYQNQLRRLLSGLKHLELYSHSLFSKDKNAPRKWSALMAVQTMSGLNLDILTIRCSTNSEVVTCTTSTNSSEKAWAGVICESFYLRQIRLTSTKLKIQKARGNGNKPCVDVMA